MIVFGGESSFTGDTSKRETKRGKIIIIFLLLWELGGGYRNTTIVQLEDSMGDFLSPKKKDVFDRLWWRIELYGRHQQKGNKKGKNYYYYYYYFFFFLLLWELGGGYRNTTIVQLEDSMGDFLSPKKKDVFDRLWWRIELYKRHHDGCHSRHELTVNGTWDQHREDIRLLRQRWLESKAKKATSKHPLP